MSMCLMIALSIVTASGLILAGYALMILARHRLVALASQRLSGSLAVPGRFAATIVSVMAWSVLFVPTCYLLYLGWRSSSPCDADLNGAWAPSRHIIICDGSRPPQ